MMKKNAVFPALILLAVVALFFRFDKSVKRYQLDIKRSQSALVMSYQRMADLIPPLAKELRQYSLSRNELMMVANAESLYQEKYRNLRISKPTDYSQFDKEMFAVESIVSQFIQLGIRKKTLLKDRNFLDLERIYFVAKKGIEQDRQDLYSVNQKYNSKIHGGVGKVFAKLMKLKPEPFFTPILVASNKTT
jgi:hypothetical protein